MVLNEKIEEWSYQKKHVSIAHFISIQHYKQPYPSVCHLQALTGWVRGHFCNQMVLGLGSVPLLEHLSCKTDVSVSLECIGFNFTFPDFLACIYSTVQKFFVFRFQRARFHSNILSGLQQYFSRLSKGLNISLGPGCYFFHSFCIWFLYPVSYPEGDCYTLLDLWITA